MRTLLAGLDRLNRGIERVLVVLLLFLLFGFLTLVIYQLASRNLEVLPRAFWTEEMSRFLFQWMVMLGAAIGVLRADHFVLKALHPTNLIGRIAAWTREILMLLVAVAFVWFGYDFGISGLRRTSTAAQLPMIWVYSAFCVAGVLMVLFSLQRVLTMVQGGAADMERRLDNTGTL